MTRETKINLGFLVAFLALTLPGAVMMFNRKLQPGQRMQYEPSFMRRTEAYNNPLPATSSAIRTFPPNTLAWTNQVSRERIGRPPYRLVAAGGREQPIISQGRRFEVLGAAEGTVAVLVWSDDFATADGTAVTGSVTYDGATRAVSAVRAETLVVPEDVVQELLDEGLQKPPRRVSLLRLDVAGDGIAGPPRRVDLAWRERDGRDVRDAAALDPRALEAASQEAVSHAALDAASAGR